MPNFDVISSIGSHESKVILNTTVCTGIQSISFSQNINEEFVSLVGNTAVPKQTTAPVVTTVSIDKLLVSESDFIHKLTGINQTGISGSFQYGDRYMFFNNAVIDGYSVNASIGELPTISFDMSIYGDFSGGSFSIDGTGSSPKAVAQSDATVRPTLNSGIIFQYADFGRNQDVLTDNHPQSFTYSEVYNWLPTYSISKNGSHHRPASINLLGPIQQSMSVTMDIHDTGIERNYSFTGTQETVDRAGVSKGTVDRNRVVRAFINSDIFQVKNASLTSQNLSQQVGDTTILTSQFDGYRTLEPSLIPIYFRTQGFASAAGFAGFAAYNGVGAQGGDPIQNKTIENVLSLGSSIANNSTADNAVTKDDFTLIGTINPNNAPLGNQVPNSGFFMPPHIISGGFDFTINILENLVGGSLTNTTTYKNNASVNPNAVIKIIGTSVDTTTSPDTLSAHYRVRTALLNDNAEIFLTLKA
jgi:hypothetical protein